MQTRKSIRLTESAIMLAFATVLSLVKIVDLPYGGSITACSMLPILLIAYRYGTAWGLFTAAAFSLLQIVTGMSSFTYVNTPQAVIAVLVFDYVLAFMALGLGGVFRKSVKDQGAALAAGTLLACAVRYVCHVVVGCTIWAGLSIPTSGAIVYSLAYNATYMVPETIITILGAVYVSRVLDFRSEFITRCAPQARRPDAAIFFSGLAKALLAAAAAWDVKEIALPLQNAETGDFDITGIANVNWLSVGVATAVGVVLALIFFYAARRVPADSQVSLRGLFNALPFVGVAAAAVGGGFFIASELADIAADPEGALYGWLKIVVLALAVVAAFVFVLLRYRGKKNQAVQG